ncbi:MAG: Ig domain-containing protein [Thermoleophilia bacterium]
MRALLRSLIVIAAALLALPALAAAHTPAATAGCNRATDTYDVVVGFTGFGGPPIVNTIRWSVSLDGTVVKSGDHVFSGTTGTLRTSVTFPDARVHTVTVTVGWTLPDSTQPDRVILTQPAVECTPPPSVSYAGLCLNRGGTLGSRPLPVAPAELRVTGTPRFSVSPALPAGLSLDPATGAITGSPAAEAATATYTVTVTDSSGSATAPLSLTVLGDVGFSYARRPAAGQPFDGTPTVTGAGAGTLRFTSQTVPAGMTLDPDTGRLSGTPPKTAFQATVRMTVLVGGAPCGENSLVVAQRTPPSNEDFAPCPGLPKRYFVPFTEVRDTPQQMWTNRDHATAAVRKMSAIERWLKAGVAGRDICGNSIGTAALADDIPAFLAAPRRASSRPAARAVSGYRFTLNPKGRLDITNANFAATEALIRDAERRFVALRAVLQRGVAGSDLAGPISADAKLQQPLYVTSLPSVAAAIPAPAPFTGAKAPASFCSEGPSVHSRMACQHARAIRMIHMANVLKRAIANRVHGIKRDFTVAQAVNGPLPAARRELRRVCPGTEFPSGLCRQVLGKSRAVSDAAIRSWLRGLYAYENAYLGGSVRWFGMAEGQLGAGDVIPGRNPS